MAERRTTNHNVIKKEISIWSGVDVTFSRLTLQMTDSFESTCRMLNQTPMFWARSATGRRYSHTNLCASRRISTQLLRRAKSGARGNAATKMVINPNWSTAADNWNFLHCSFIFTYVYHTACYWHLFLVESSSSSCSLLDTVEETCPSPGTLRTGLHTPPGSSLPPIAEAQRIPYAPELWTKLSSGARPSLYCQIRETERHLMNMK